MPSTQLQPFAWMVPGTEPTDLPILGKYSVTKPWLFAFFCFQFEL